MRLVVVFLVHTLAVRGGVGDRYSDYSAAGLPNYNMDYGNRGAAHVDEYPDRSPDASVLLDYKYEEDSRDAVKTFPGKHADEDLWQKPKAKGRRSNKITHNNEGEIDASEDLVPKYKSNRRFIKHRTRIKDAEIEKPSRRLVHNPRRSENIDDLDDRDDFELSKRHPHEGNIDSDRFAIRHTTLRVPRRKPRDRTIKQAPDPSFEADSDEDIAKLKRVDDSDNIDNIIKNHPLKDLVKNKVNSKAYPDYEEYENMDLKRINKLKNRLPELFRRTKASEPEPASTRRLQEFYYRRAFPSEEAETSTVTWKPVTTTTEKPTSSEVQTTQTTNATEPAPSVQTTMKINSNLSLAEQSRLSILKKAQRKESSKNKTTTKPPVLLQVTNKLQTMVMVERIHQEPVLRARQIFEDSPERIQKAKELMRRKLIAGARNIHELTDNWDELICDYIDLSLLDNKTNDFCYSASPETTTTKPASVAERELRALLGHRQRKDIPVTAPIQKLPATFAPYAVDAYVDDQWNTFIVTNNTHRALKYQMAFHIRDGAGEVAQWRRERIDRARNEGRVVARDLRSGEPR
ncbi:unnamed protein product [Danaus chrysippus]|uniref:(African queen) hypothetical protein n=1 Tax=Danaus chrysippus TaxID=151541 RepID=A0A8J2MHF7_9NEOP|nr:unnamed protein product [Danaus chrysippus]